MSAQTNISDWPYSITRPAILDMTPYSARGGATNALHLAGTATRGTLDEAR